MLKLDKETIQNDIATLVMLKDSKDYCCMWHRITCIYRVYIWTRIDV